MKQKTMTLMVLAALIVLVSSCNWKVEKHFKSSNGPKVTKNIENVAPFERIRIDAPCNVYFTQGNTTKVKMVASDSEVMKKTKVMVGGGCLDIRMKGKGWSNWKKKRSATIYVTSPDLIEVNMHGAGNFEVEGQLDTDTLRLQLKGAGNMDFHQLQTQQAELNLRGVGNIDAHFVKSGSVRCTLQGVGVIDLSGEVKSLEKKVQGTGKIGVSNLKIN